MTEASHSFGVSVSYFVSNPAANLIFIHFHLMIWDKGVGDPTLMYIKVIDQKGRVDSHFVFQAFCQPFSENFILRWNWVSELIFTRPLTGVESTSGNSVHLSVRPSSLLILFLFFQTLSSGESRNLSHGIQCPPSMSPMPAPTPQSTGPPMKWII